MIDSLYGLFLGTAGVLGLTLFVLSCRIAHRRATVPYILVTIALGALASRSLVGLLGLLGIVDYGLHHLLEHGLDVVIAISLFAAVLAMGRPDSTSWGESEP